MPNPWQTIQAQKVGYKVLAMWGKAQDFKGIFIVREKSTVKVPADLRGKAVSYPSPTALAAAIMPQYFLHQHRHQSRQRNQQLVRWHPGVFHYERLHGDGGRREQPGRRRGASFRRTMRRKRSS